MFRPCRVCAAGGSRDNGCGGRGWTAAVPRGTLHYWPDCSCSSKVHYARRRDPRVLSHAVNVCKSAAQRPATCIVSKSHPAPPDAPPFTPCARPQCVCEGGGWESTQAFTAANHRIHAWVDCGCLRKTHLHNDSVFACFAEKLRRERALRDAQRVVADWSA